MKTLSELTTITNSILDVVRVVTPTCAQRTGNSLFSSLSTDGNPLAVGRPGNVLDLPRDWLVLIFENMFLLSGVPDPDLTRYV